MRSIVLAAMLTLCVSYAISQETAAPTAGPSTRPTSQPSAVLEPVKEGTTRPSEAVNLKYREGTYLIDQIGRLTHDKAGAAKFVFESEGKTIELVVMANENLAKMEDAATAERDIRFKITGMATEYRGKNYILIERAEVMEIRNSSGEIRDESESDLTKK